MKERPQDVIGKPVVIPPCERVGHEHRYTVVIIAQALDDGRFLIFFEQKHPEWDD